MSNRRSPHVLVTPRTDRIESRIPADREYLSYDEVGKIIGVSSRTVREYCKQGRLPYAKTGYKTVRIARTAVQEFMARSVPKKEPQAA
jgi:excisionase family DNA binding protein